MTKKEHARRFRLAAYDAEENLEAGKRVSLMSYYALGRCDDDGGDGHREQSAIIRDIFVDKYIDSQQEVAGDVRALGLHLVATLLEAGDA